MGIMAPAKRKGAGDGDEPTNPPKADGGGTSRKPVRKGEPLHVWINPAISQALDTYLEGTAPRVSKTAAVEEALRRFLAAVGVWPPQSAKE